VGVYASGVPVHYHFSSCIGELAGGISIPDGGRYPISCSGAVAHLHSADCAGAQAEGSSLLSLLAQAGHVVLLYSSKNTAKRGSDLGASADEEMHAVVRS